ncbi:MAG: hypothetical protein ACI4RT_04320 [Candidatus Spyradenecus sp.]
MTVAPPLRPRQAAPEVYRVALMFGICLLHSITFSAGDRALWPWRLLHSCVDGFAFLSGWYGLTFRPSKFIRLYALALFCGGLIFCFGWLTDAYPLALDLATLKLIRGLLVGPWFLNAYALLMLLAPLVDAVLTWVPPAKRLPILLPPLAITFLWAFAQSIPRIGGIFPKTPGVDSYAGLTLFGIYTLARLWRLGDWDRFLVGPRLYMALGVLMMLSIGGFYAYASPVAALLSGCTFLLFRRIPWPDWIGRVALWLGPSMFAVYLLHCNRVILPAFEPLEQAVMNALHCPRLIAYPLATLPIFALCLAIDLPRRALLALTQRLWKPLLQRLDALYTRHIGEA